MYVYFENYGRYDWTRYFYGYAGLDLRWSNARRAAWAARFAAAGVKERVLEVMHEDDHSKVGVRPPVRPSVREGT